MKFALTLLAAATLLCPRPAAAEPTLVPVIQGEWIHVYQPQPDIFPGPDSARFKTGRRYDDWQVNDHCILKGPDNRWHAFGITHPAIPGHEPNPHEGEWSSFHAAADVGSFKEQARPGAWKDYPKILPPSERPGEIKENHAPFTLHHQGQYWMFYGKSPIRLATSPDLWNWTPRGEVFSEADARDPHVLSHHGVFYLSYTTQQSVRVRTSPNLKDWSEPTTIYTLPEGEKGGPESSTLLALHGGFYLIWCRWDPKLSKQGFTYQDRSFVFYSDTPLDFKNRRPVAEIQGHAPEFFQDEDGDWWISSAERPKRGVSVAPVKWLPMTAPADVQSPATLPPASGDSATPVRQPPPGGAKPGAK